MSSVVELAKRLQDLEAYAKLLRNDVYSLEATKRNLAISESTSIRANELQRQSEEEMAAADEATLGAKQRSRKSAALTKQRVLPLPLNFIDDLNRKASEVQVQIDEHHRLVEERDSIAALLDTTEMAAQEAEQTYAGLVEVAKPDENGSNTGFVSWSKKMENADATRQLLEAYRERELLSNQLNHQSDALQRLAAVVEERATSLRQLQEAKDVLAEKKDRLAELRRENVALENDIRRKDHICERKHTGPTTENIISSANYSRRVALYELEKEGEQLKSNDAAIRHRAMQIAKCEKRLEMIGDAVAGDGLSEEERVDAELMNTLIMEISALYKLRTETNIRMDVLDADVEVAEYKIDALRQSIAGTRREIDNVNVGHERYRQTLQNGIDQEQQNNAEEIRRLEKEVKTLRRTSHKGRRTAKSGRKNVKVGGN